ncbi:MAG: hypothetical protein ACRDWD_01795 [Acidimicrobiia bacterium]
MVRVRSAVEVALDVDNAGAIKNLEKDGGAVFADEGEISSIVDEML